MIFFLLLYQIFLPVQEKPVEVSGTPAGSSYHITKQQFSLFSKRVDFLFLSSFVFGSLFSFGFFIQFFVFFIQLYINDWCDGSRLFLLVVVTAS